MEIRIFQKGFNYSQDGQGNRLVYHLQGCNMRCCWCANPEGISPEPALMADGAKLLESACPHGAIRGQTLDRGKCAVCKGYECMSWGADFGVRFSSRDDPLDDIVDEAVRCRPMFFGGGGVTLTGGEPTVQMEAVRALLERLKGHGIHTALETNGTHPDLPALFPLADQLILDFKHYDSQTHKEFTGLGNERVKRNIREARSRAKPLLLRIPLVNGFNAGRDDIAGFAGFLRNEMYSGLSVELMKYHEFGKDKWEKCGMKYAMENGYVQPETVSAFERELAGAGIRLVRT